MTTGLVIYMVILAAVLALWEIQIEGKNGWAGKLPCWRIEKGWISKLLGDKPLTGYHVYMNAFIIILSHLPIFFVKWSIRLESLLMAFCLGILLLEDFLWVVFNPNYGFKKFKKGQIWFRKYWWGPMPRYYWFNATIVILLFYFGWRAI